MCLNRGIRPLNTEEFFENHWKNLHRLYIWMTVGADADNGLWAIYGARQGFYKTMFTDWDFINVRDFDYLNSYWNQTLKTIDKDFLLDEIKNLGKDITDRMDIPIPISPLEPEASRFYKYTYQNPARIKPGFLKDL